MMSCINFYINYIGSAQAIRSRTVCRVLVVQREAYEGVARRFPASARILMNNLAAKAETVGY